MASTSNVTDRTQRTDFLDTQCTSCGLWYNSKGIGRHRSSCQSKAVASSATTTTTTHTTSGGLSAAVGAAHPNQNFTTAIDRRQRTSTFSQQCRCCSEWYTPQGIDAHEKWCATQLRFTTQGVRDPPSSIAAAPAATAAALLPPVEFTYLGPEAFEKALGAAPAAPLRFSPSAFGGFDTFECPRQLRLLMQRAASRATDAAAHSATVARDDNPSRGDTQRGIDFEKRVMDSLRAACGAESAMGWCFIENPPGSVKEVVFDVLRRFATEPATSRVYVSQLRVSAEPHRASLNCWAWWYNNLQPSVGDVDEKVIMGTMFPDLVIFDRLTQEETLSAQLQRATIDGPRGDDAVASPPLPKCRVTIADVKSSKRGPKRSHEWQIAFYSLVLKAIASQDSFLDQVIFGDGGEIWLDSSAWSAAMNTGDVNVSERGSRIAIPGVTIEDFTISAAETSVKKFLSEVLGPLAVGAAATTDIESVPAQRFAPESSCGICEHRLLCKALARKQRDSFALLRRPAPQCSPLFAVPSTAVVETLEAFADRSASEGLGGSAQAEEARTMLNSLGTEPGKVRWTSHGPRSLLPLDEWAAYRDSNTYAGRVIVHVIIIANDEKTLSLQTCGGDESPTSPVACVFDDVDAGLQTLVQRVRDGHAVLTWDARQATTLLRILRRAAIRDPAAECATLYVALSRGFDRDVFAATTVSACRPVQLSLLPLQQVIAGTVAAGVPHGLLDLAELLVDPSSWLRSDAYRCALAPADLLEIPLPGAAERSTIVAECGAAMLTALRALGDRIRCVAGSTVTFASQREGSTDLWQRVEAVYCAMGADEVLQARATRRSPFADPRLPPFFLTPVESYKAAKGSPGAWWCEVASAAVSHQLFDLQEAIMSGAPCLDGCTDVAIGELRSDFLTRPHWFTPVASTVTMVAAMDACLDATSYAEAPMKLARRSLHIIGYTIAAAPGGFRVLVDTTGIDTINTPVIAFERPQDFNSKKVVEALHDLVRDNGRSVIADVCTQLVLPLPRSETSCHRAAAVIAARRDLTLNAAQARAVDSACLERLTIIWGPPGTGKTTTLASLLCVALRLEEPVMALTFTHAAKNELATKLHKLLRSKKFDAARWSAFEGSQWVACRPSANLDAADDQLFATCRSPLRVHLQDGNGSIILCTPQGAAKLRSKNALPFDAPAMILVDEASQMTVPLAVLGTLVPPGSPAPRVVLAGDVLQLAPIVPSCFTARDSVLREVAPDVATLLEGSVLEAALFDAATGQRVSPSQLVPAAKGTATDGVVTALPSGVIMLDTNYRSCPVITEFVATLYPGLRAGRVDRPDGSSPEPALQRALIEAGGGVEYPARSPTIQQREIDTIVRWLSELPATSSMAVVTVHRKQRMALTAAISATPDLRGRVVVDTVDRTQGKEYDAVAVALAAVSIPFALQLNRLNVAMSRAKDRLLLVTTGSLLWPVASVRSGLGQSGAQALNYLAKFDQSLPQDIAETRPPPASDRV